MSDQEKNTGRTDDMDFSALDAELAKMAGEAPEVPEDFHENWTRMIREEAAAGKPETAAGKPRKGRSRSRETGSSREAPEGPRPAALYPECRRRVCDSGGRSRDCPEQRPAAGKNIRTGTPGHGIQYADGGGYRTGSSRIRV